MFVLILLSGVILITVRLFCICYGASCGWWWNKSGCQMKGYDAKPTHGCNMIDVRISVRTSSPTSPPNMTCTVKIKRNLTPLRYCGTVVIHDFNVFTKLCNLSGLFHPIRHLQPISCWKSDAMAKDIAVVLHVLNCVVAAFFVTFSYPYTHIPLSLA